MTNRRIARLPISWKVPLGVSALFLAIILTISSTAYLSVRRTETQGVSDDLQRTAAQVGVSLQHLAQLVSAAAGRTASHPAVRDLLTGRGSPGALGLETFREPADRDVMAVEVWSVDHRRLFTTRPDGPPFGDLRWDEPVGPLRAVAGAALFPVVAAVRDGGALLGSVVHWRRLSTATFSVDVTGATYLVGNRGGGVWTDLRRSVPPPPVPIRPERVVTYRRPDGRRIAVASLIAGTPWIGLVEMRHEQAMGEANRFGRRIAALSAALLVIGIAASWLMSRRSLETLAASERRYRSLFERAIEGVYLTTREGKCLAANPAFAHILGFDSPRELEAISDFGSQLYVDPAQRRHLMDQLESHGAVYGFEVEMRRRDGSTAWIRSNVRAVRDAAGRFVQIEGMCEDITERRRTEAALRESEELHRALFWNSPLPMWLFDILTLRILIVNDAAVKQYGYSREELLSMTIKDVRPPEDVEHLLETHRAAGDGYYSASTYRHSGVWRHVRKDGTPLEVDVHIQDVTVAGRRHRLALLHDVTEQRRVEERFRQAQKMEAVGRLAGGVAHDFNNLLTVINGYSDLLLGSLERDATARGAVTEIANAGERAAVLTRQLLSFSRKQVVAPATIDLNAVVTGIASLLRRLIGEDVEIVHELAAGLWPVRADAGQIEQVIMNLAVNARDAMPAGGRLVIETRNVELDETAARAVSLGAGSYVVLAMTDDGTGMDDETKSHLFEPFFTTKEPGKGTGLGLATVYGIVQQCGGRIAVESEPGKGARFGIHLPRVAAAARPASRPSLRLVRRPHTGTVLLVEDEASVRGLATDVLLANGYTVLAAEGPAAAVAIAERHPGEIDVMLTDVVMPGMHGPDLVERVRERRPAIRSIFMSGYTDHSAFREGAPGCAFIQKPFRPAELVGKVEDLLQARA